MIDAACKNRWAAEVPSGSKPGSFLLFAGNRLDQKNKKEEGFFMKKIIAIMLAALSLLSLAACGA